MPVGKNYTKAVYESHNGKDESKLSKWEKVGVIGVDAGLCWLGDPCYFMQGKSEHFPATWEDFINLNNGDCEGQFNYKAGHPGLGVCVSTGYGDGEYDVMVKRKGGRIAEVKIKFI